MGLFTHDWYKIWSKTQAITQIPFNLMWQMHPSIPNFPFSLSLFILENFLVASAPWQTCFPPRLPVTCHLTSIQERGVWTQGERVWAREERWSEFWSRSGGSGRKMTQSPTKWECAWRERQSARCLLHRSQVHHVSICQILTLFITLAVVTLHCGWGSWKSIVPVAFIVPMQRQ